MTITKKAHYSQFIIFIFCAVIFCAAAVFGWKKLYYGFNFIDEGYHMTESWRLASGDDFLEDKITGALIHYTLINNLIFLSYPDITLLDFRKIQYLLTILSLLFFGYTLLRVSKQYCWLPLIFSIYAFTGLDPTGMISNLNYHTYPHLFLTLHLSFFLSGIYTEKLSIRKICYLLSGFNLWLISLSCLYLNVIVLSPILIFFFSNKLKAQFNSFTFKDLLYVLSPYIICWLIFIIVFNKSYIRNIIESLNLVLSIAAYSPSSTGGLFNFNWEAAKYISITISHIFLFYFFIKKIPLRFSLVGCTTLSVLIYILISTSCFGLLTAYYSGLFNAPTWFSSLLIAFAIFFWIKIIKKISLKEKLKKEEVLSIFLMVPFSVCAMTKSIFSDSGMLSVSQASIPVFAAMAYTLKLNKVRTNANLKQVIILIILLAPFYFTTAIFDWNFTYYDVPPKHMNAKISKGFGKGIHTNIIYFQLHEWVRNSAEKYTTKNDYVISYVTSPMVHMITKRLPALDETFITFGMPMKYHKKSVEFMHQRSRLPKMAFVFESMPRLALGKGRYYWLSKQFIFDSYSPDPISKYINKNMVLVDEFEISKDNIVRCFVDRIHLNERYASK
jgi:hypothetical protein